MKKILILLLIWLFGVVNAENNWQLVKEKNNIYIYSLQKAHYKLHHYKAQTSINKDADTILAALQDTEACSQWVYNCISNDMVDMTDVRKRIYRTVIHSPLWFKDRDFYLQSSVIYDQDEKEFTINFVSKPDYAKESNDMVRIKQVEMTWRLKYLANDKTLVTYQVYINPKLPIKTINHMMIKKSVFQTLLGLKKVVENPIYSEIKYSKFDLEMLSEDN
jgi:pyruvate formate-lyase activating enzyme-like uncharacterized protein